MSVDFILSIVMFVDVYLKNEDVGKYFTMNFTQT